MHDYISLTEAAKLTPTRPHVATIHRWARRGLKARNGRRVRLRHVRVGGQIYTTVAWLESMYADLAAADSEHFVGLDDAADTAEVSRPRHRTDAQRERDIADAEAELDAAGI